MAARVAHNHEVAGSSPAPATKVLKREAKSAKNSDSVVFRFLLYALLFWSIIARVAQLVRARPS